jgi:hypothetical protein
MEHVAAHGMSSGFPLNETDFVRHRHEIKALSNLGWRKHSGKPPAGIVWVMSSSLGPERTG